MSKQITLMNSQRLQRTIKRMCFEILEANKDDSPLLLFGINERGLALAKKLAAVFSDIWDGDLSVVPIQIDNEAEKNTFNGNVDKPEESMLLVVDDVIFSGETMFGALTKISKELDPTEIHTVSLVDRGHRKFPIRAGFCGMKLPTKPNEHVAVIIGQNSNQEVYLERM